MQQNSPSIHKAVFSPKFKKYIFLIVLFYLFASVIGIVLVPIWLLGLGQWLSKLFFKTLKCELSEKNLYFSKGIILHIEKTIPLENIQDLSFIGGPILRSMGLTFIKVETAGGGGSHHNNIMSIPAVENAEAFKNMILAQREIVINSKNSSKNNTNSEDILVAIKNELVEIKSILAKQEK
ncbi:MAG: PH domain-containing protein [Bacteroidota bacterium]